MSTDRLSQVLSGLLVKASVEAAAPYNVSRDGRSSTYCKAYNDALDDICGEWDAMQEFVKAMNNEQRRALTWLLNGQYVIIIARQYKENDPYINYLYIHHELTDRVEGSFPQQLSPEDITSLWKFLQHKPKANRDEAVLAWINGKWGNFPLARFQTEYTMHLINLIKSKK